MTSNRERACGAMLCLVEDTPTQGPGTSNTSRSPPSFPPDPSGIGESRDLPTDGDPRAGAGAIAGGRWTAQPVRRWVAMGTRTGRWTAPGGQRTWPGPLRLPAPAASGNSGGLIGLAPGSPAFPVPLVPPDSHFGVGSPLDFPEARYITFRTLRCV